MNHPPIQTASIKVMRSHDYCHFEVALSIAVDAEPRVIGPSGAPARPVEEIHIEQVDALRKAAARLADKAVEQYKIAKAQRQRVENFGDSHSIIAIKEMAETDRTPDQKAQLKQHEDERYAASRQYDYQDDWQD